MNQLKTLVLMVLAMCLMIVVDCGGDDGSSDSSSDTDSETQSTDDGGASDSGTDAVSTDGPSVSVPVALVNTYVGQSVTIPVTAKNTDFAVSVNASDAPYMNCVKTESSDVACVPTAVGAYTVTVTAIVDSSKTASAIVMVSDVAISIAPNEANVAVNEPKILHVMTYNTDFTVSTDPAVGCQCVKTNSASVTCTPTSVGTYLVTVSATALASRTATAILSVGDNGVTSIDVTRLPNKTQYYTMETELDLTGMVVTATYQNGSKTTLTADQYSVSGFDSSTAGQNTLTVAYGSLTAPLVVTILARSLMSISVVPPSKVVYLRNEPFDATGMVVTARYNVGPDVVATNYVLSGFDSGFSGSRIVTVSYTEGTITTTAAFIVTVNELQWVSIAVTRLPTKTTYHCGETLDPAGMVVTAIRNDGFTMPVSGYSIVGGDEFSLSGANTIYVHYTNLSTSFIVNVSLNVELALDTYGGRSNGLVGFNMHKAVVTWKAKGICSDMATRVGLLYTTRSDVLLMINSQNADTIEQTVTGPNPEITSTIYYAAGFESGTKIRYRAFVVIGSYLYVEQYSPEHSFVPRNNQTTIHNLTWSTQNVIDQSGTLGGIDYITHFQWNRKTAWPYSYDNLGTPSGWNSTEDTSLTWADTNRPLAEGWRLPTSSEFIYLRDLSPGRTPTSTSSYFDGICMSREYSIGDYGCFLGPEADLAAADVRASNSIVSRKRLAILLFAHAGRWGDGSVDKQGVSSAVGYRFSYATSESYNLNNMRYFRAEATSTNWYIDVAYRSKASGVSIRPVKDFDPNN